VSAIPTSVRKLESATPALLSPDIRGEVPTTPQRALRTGQHQAFTIGTSSGLTTSLVLFVTNAVAIAIAGAIGYSAAVALASDAFLAFLSLRAVVVMGILQLVGLRLAGSERAWGISPVASLARSVRIMAGATLVIVAVLIALGQSWQSLVAVLVAGICSTIFVLAGRSIVFFLLGRAHWWGRRIFVVGSDKQAAALYSELLRQPQRGLRPIGFIDDLETLDTELDPALYLGPPEALRELAVEHGVTAAVVAKSSPDSQTQRLFCREELGIRDWILMSSLEGYPSLWGEAVEVTGIPALLVRNRLLSPWSRGLKRAADLAITLTSVLLALPLLVAIMTLVRLGSPGSIFYGQERIGRHGRRFKAWKFRTMVVNADEVLEAYLASDPLLQVEWDANHKLKDDPRITWIGKFLRKTSLDELPQLWNVIRGEMSLVGPRPIVVAEIDKYADDYEYYVDVLPGITGLWQVSGRNNTTYPERVAFDAYYVKNWSLWLDLYILVSTIRVILFREGAY
jgi:Undecaprenyl-phosphate galactose phosphotransferase WbaP